MKKFVKIAIIIASVFVMSVNIFAATPLYKPVKLPKIQITLPHYDFSYAVEQYLKEHPVT